MGKNINLSSLIGLKKQKSGSDPLIGFCNCSQSKPEGYYVYAHCKNKTPFYIGKSNGRRAFENSRNAYWHFLPGVLRTSPRKVTHDYLVN